MRRDKSISVRFAAVGGQAVKAEMREIGTAGKQAMQGITAGTGPASDKLEQFGWVAAQARSQLEALAAKSAATAAALRTTSNATTAMQQQVNRATGVTTPSGMSAAEMLQQGQALDELRAKFNPLYAAIREYRAEVSEIRAAHAEGAISADEMRASIDRVRASSLAAIDRIKGTTAALKEQALAAKQAAAASQQEADAKDALRAKYNPLFAVISRYKAEQAAIRQAHKEGALSADEMKAALDRLRTASLGQIAVVKGQTQAIEQMSRETRGGALRMQQMFFQVNDIGVSLAGGMNPFVVMAQQGTQIAQIYGYGGGGVAGIFEDLKGLVTSLPAPLKAAAGGAGLALAAILGMQHEINKTSDITVSFGDTAMATFEVLADRIAGVFAPEIEKIGEFFEDMWQRTIRATKQTGNDIIHAAQIMRAGIEVAIDYLPAIFSAGFNKAAAWALEAIARIAWGVHKMLTDVAAGFNAIFKTDIQVGVGIQRAGNDLAEAALGRIGAANAATAGLAGAQAEFAKRAGEILATDPMGEFFNDVSAEAQQNARDREKDKKGGGGRAKKAKEEKDEVADLIKKLQEELSVMRETDPVKKRLLGYSEEMAKATAAERAQIESLVRQLDQAEHGWEAVGRAMAEFSQDSKRLGDDLGDALVSAAEASGDAWAEFTKTGKLNFSDMISSFSGMVLNRFLLGVVVQGLTMLSWRMLTKPWACAVLGLPGWTDVIEPCVRW